MPTTMTKATISNRGAVMAAYHLFLRLGVSISGVSISDVSIECVPSVFFPGNMFSNIIAKLCQRLLHHDRVAARILRRTQTALPPQQQTAISLEAGQFDGLSVGW